MTASDPERKSADKKIPLTAATAGALIGILVAVAGIAFWQGGTIHRHRHSESAGPAAGGQQAEKKTLYTCGMHPWIVAEEPGDCPICGMKLTPKEDDSGGSTSQARKIVYWRAPMDPTEIYHEPGKSKMGMDLVPVYEDEVIGGVEVRIDPLTRQNMGIRTARAEKGALRRSIRTYGHLTYDETATRTVSPKFSGWIEKLHVDFTGIEVGRGDPLFDVYSPELFSAQQEYLAAVRARDAAAGDRTRQLLAAAERRLAFWDVPRQEIEALAASGKPSKALTIRSPFAGVVIRKNAAEGEAVKAGMPVLTLADLSTIWVEAHIFEYELPWVEVGAEAEMTLPYHPGRIYRGRVTYIYPYLEKQARDVVVRLEFDNAAGELKPDMYADVIIATSARGEGTIIPAEAVIRSGRRNLVFVTAGDGSFIPREITPGLSLDNGRIQVLTGIAPGEIVVTSGQFLIDSESKLKEAVQKMLAAKSGAEPQEEQGKATDDFFSDMEQQPAKAQDDFFSDMEPPAKKGGGEAPQP
ncbi:MAG: efflux RND transporter periplasmic adaptor subunit [Thermodesulfobacteriota bacterium]